MIKRAKYLGIGLLELMLSLAIIAILLIMAIRYYQSANTSEQLNGASNMFNAVRSAMKNYYNDNLSGISGSSVSTVAQPSIQDLVNAGYLPSTFGDGSSADPWGGDIAIMSSTSNTSSCKANSSSSIANRIAPGTSYSVCMGGLPGSNVANQLANKVTSTLDTTRGESVTAGKSVVVVNYKY